MENKNPNQEMNDGDILKDEVKTAFELLRSVSDKPYYLKRIKEILSDLLELKRFLPEQYTFYMKRLDEAIAIEAKEVKDFKPFDIVIEEIKCTKTISRRTLVNTRTDKIAEAAKRFFDNHQGMEELNDASIAEFQNVLEANANKEEEIYFEEDSALKSVDGSDLNWEEVISESRENYTQSLLVADYRINMLILMNDILHHKDRLPQDPFVHYTANPEGYIRLLIDDINALKTRYMEMMQYHKAAAMLNPIHSVILSYKKELESRLKDHYQCREKGNDCTFGYKAGDSGMCFFKLARRLTEANVLMNQLALSVENVEKSKKNKALERSETNEEIDEKLKTFESPNEAFRYQFGIATSRGLITDQNLIMAITKGKLEGQENPLNVKAYKPRAVLSLIEKAEELGDNNIIVFPAIYDTGSHFYGVYAKCKLRESEALDSPFVQLPEKHEKVEFVGKLPESMLEFYRQKLFVNGINDGIIKNRMYYEYDEDTGMYNFYYKTEPSVTFNQEMVKRYRYRVKDVHNTVSFMTQQKVDYEDPRKCIFDYFFVPGNKNLIAVLEELNKASIMYFVKHDKDKGRAVVYLDPTREDEAVQLLWEFDYLDIKNAEEKDDSTHFKHDSYANKDDFSKNVFYDYNKEPKLEDREY